jgi:hypothetical protein
LLFCWLIAQRASLFAGQRRNLAAPLLENKKQKEGVGFFGKAFALNEELVV